MMKVLYVDVNARFINPTRSLIACALLMRMDVRFFGPGFISTSVLEDGLEAFVDSTGPYDVIIANSLFLFGDFSEVPLTLQDFKENYAVKFGSSDVACIPDIARALEKIDGVKRVAVLLESDFYDWSERYVEALERRADVFVPLAGPEFWSANADRPNLFRESFASRATDCWFNFLQNRSRACASMPHFIGDSEFNYTALQSRSQDWSILGVKYAARRTAQKILKDNGLGVDSGSKSRRFIGALKKAKLLKGETELTISYLNADFRARMAASRYSYTCGSGLGMPIRKFFEIPAAGSVLVCQPFVGFAHAGFIDRENCIVCEPGDIIEVHHWLSADTDRAQEIARNGQKLIAWKHSVSARAQEFYDIVSMVAVGRFNGATWRDGRFELSPA